MHLFIDELDGETYPTTTETFTQDVSSFWDWQSEQRIARTYGDCGREI